MTSNKTLKGASRFCSCSCSLVTLTSPLTHLGSCLLARSETLACSSSPGKPTFQNLDSLLGRSDICGVRALGRNHTAQHGCVRPSSGSRSTHGVITFRRCVQLQSRVTSRVEAFIWITACKSSATLVAQYQVLYQMPDYRSWTGWQRGVPHAIVQAQRSSSEGFSQLGRAMITQPHVYFMTNRKAS